MLSRGHWILCSLNPSLPLPIPPSPPSFISARFEMNWGEVDCPQCRGVRGLIQPRHDRSNPFHRPFRYSTHRPISFVPLALALLEYTLFPRIGHVGASSPTVHQLPVVHHTVKCNPEMVDWKRNATSINSIALNEEVECIMEVMARCRRSRRRKSKSCNVWQGIRRRRCHM